jgi:hypothetical protein
MTGFPNLVSEKESGIWIHEGAGESELPAERV